METDHVEDLGVEGRITLQWVLKDMRAWSELNWLRIEKITGCCDNRCRKMRGVC